MKHGNEPTWVKVGDKIVTKVVSVTSFGETIRSRYYGTVTSAHLEYVVNASGWQVNPICEITGFVVAKRSSKYHGSALDVSPVQGERVRYVDFLRILREAEWKGLAMEGWPYDFQKFERVLNLEVELAIAKGTLPMPVGLHVVKGGAS